MLFTAIIAFLVIFSLLILVHEWGHFAAARRFGVQVEEFGIGLPPRARKLWRDQKKTIYTLNWLPLGGFVRMKGEDDASGGAQRAKNSFSARPIWQRITIIVAGVVMNIIAGFVLLVFVFSIGNTYLAPSDQADELIAKNPTAELVSSKPLGVLVQRVLPDSAAADSELRRFDFIAAVDGQTFASADEFQQLVEARSEQPTTLSILRREHEFELTLTPSAEGKIGVAIAGPLTAVQLRYSPLAAVGQAASETVRLTKLITQGIGRLFGNLLHGSLPEDIGGPVAIAKETFYRASSLVALLSFAAMLSITLAIFNILPIPALDGGRLIFLIYEAITRRRPNPNVEAKIHAAGYILLIGLILLISWQDIFR